MQSKGRSIHVFDVSQNCRKVEVIACPRDPKIEMSRTRWITVGPRGHLFMTSGDNVKSALWTYIRSKKVWIVRRSIGNIEFLGMEASERVSEI